MEPPAAVLNSGFFVAAGGFFNKHQRTLRTKSCGSTSVTNLRKHQKSPPTKGKTIGKYHQPEPANGRRPFPPSLRNTAFSARRKPPGSAHRVLGTGAGILQGPARHLGSVGVDQGLAGPGAGRRVRGARAKQAPQISAPKKTPICFWSQLVRTRTSRNWCVFLGLSRNMARLGKREEWEV